MAPYLLVGTLLTYSYAHRTLARSFSAALDDAFGIDTDLEGLSQSVEQKSAVSSRIC